MIKFSKNKKTNKLLNSIYEDLKELGTEQVLAYIKDFPREKDYNIVNYGNLLCYYCDVYNLYRECGYKSTDKMSADKIWEIYRSNVGYVARCCFKHNYYKEEI